MYDKSDTAAVVLTGGASKRFKQDTGTNKAFFKLNEKSFLQIAVERSTQIADEIYLSVRSMEQYNQLLDHLDTDLVHSVQPLLDNTSISNIGGALLGVITGIQNIKTSYIIFQAIDYPYVSSEDLKLLVNSLEHNTHVFDTPLQKFEISTYFTAGNLTFSLFAINREITETKLDGLLNLSNSRLLNLYRGAYSVIVHELNEVGQFINVNHSHDLNPHNTTAEIVNKKLVLPGRRFWAIEKMSQISGFSKFKMIEQLEREKEVWSYKQIIDQIDSDIRFLQ